MNAKKLIAAFAVLAAAGSAFAGDVDYPFADNTQLQSTKTRADVVAELKASQANGDYAVSDSEFPAPAVKLVPTKARADVVTELKQSHTDGSYAVEQRAFDSQYPVL
jgi:anti-sigma28 factor (negative regulator of flagellin synthesis)